MPSRKSAGLPAANTPGDRSEPAPADGKALHSLTGLMEDISACRVRLQKREAAIADLQRRLHVELQPLRDAMLEVRVDTFRVLGRHLRAGLSNRRAQKTLELALYDLAHELESEFGVDLRSERSKVFEDEMPDADAGFGEDGEDEGADHDDGNDRDPGAFRESDFDAEREGRGDWQETGRREGKGERTRSGGGRDRGHAKTPSGESRDEAITGDIRALYLMLARALHPDKESDPARLAGKTAWMQKVTAAYAARDLARLLDILAANPMDAVGPYLSQAPLKTVQGFAKRLRRELDALHARLAHLDAGLDPFLAALMKQGDVNETAYGILLAQARKELKFMKQRRDVYRTAQGVHGLIDALGSHDWRTLM
jgi:hypothetical protein